MSTIDVLVIEPGSWVAERRAIEPDLQAFQGIVGGYIEALDLSDGVSAWINEEGKLNGLARNEAADKLWKHAIRKDGRRNLPGDFIAGPMVIFGDRGDGETYSVPDTVGELLAEVGLREGQPGEPAVRVILPEGEIPARLTGYDRRSLVSHFDVEGDDQLKLSISTGHSKERKAYYGFALGVRQLPSNGNGLSAELSAPMSGVRLGAVPTARFSQKDLAAYHRAVVESVRDLIRHDPSTFDGVLMATPKRDD